MAKLVTACGDMAPPPGPAGTAASPGAVRPAAAIGFITGGGGANVVVEDG